MERLKAKGIKVFIDVDKNLKTPSDLANGEGADENSAKQNVDKQSCEDDKDVEDDDDVNDDCCGESCDAEIGNTACWSSGGDGFGIKRCCLFGVEESISR